MSRDPGRAYDRAQPCIIWEIVDNHFDSLLSLLTEFASNQN